MIANHIHDALAQVGKLQEFILERNRFKGYSGTARLASGMLVLCGAWIMDSAPFPRAPQAHLLGWTGVLAVGLTINYGALIYWFLFDREVRRNPLMLKPALDAIPPLAVGALFGLALILRQQYDMLFGACLCLYGLAQVAYRRSLPGGIYWIGLAYVTTGAAFLFDHRIVFTEPWPMAIALCVGELAGGLLLVRDHRRSPRKEME
jgi:hypothetical protein